MIKLHSKIRPHVLIIASPDEATSYQVIICSIKLIYPAQMDLNEVHQALVDPVLKKTASINLSAEESSKKVLGRF
ncbi:hypothetical protein OQJ26_07670 [Legionella sp. PATHC038]|uniref:hypothetical protein n=1 Tax=Legionella sheltonii TaxID=2992041 RepID=UPI00224388E6|nr:hypothetical protein [Legionella sp. PATHC038]MCW8398667.1 hypothetical protein [Legionella sp. PATHC038]